MAASLYLALDLQVCLRVKRTLARVHTHAAVVVGWLASCLGCDAWPIKQLTMRSSHQRAPVCGA